MALEVCERRNKSYSSRCSMTIEKISTGRSWRPKGSIELIDMLGFMGCKVKLVSEG
jgi:hypothetical protein